MTEAAREMLEVTQADRHAAVAWHRLVSHGGGGYNQRLLDGLADEDPLIQAFARHRIAALLSSPLAVEALGAADYLIDRLRRLHAGQVVRDLEEAGVAYDRARGLLPAAPQPPSPGQGLQEARARGEELDQLNAEGAERLTRSLDELGEMIARLPNAPPPSGEAEAVAREALDYLLANAVARFKAFVQGLRPNDPDGFVYAATDNFEKVIRGDAEAYLRTLSPNADGGDHE